MMLDIIGEFWGGKRLRRDGGSGGEVRENFWVEGVEDLWHLLGSKSQLIIGIQIKKILDIIGAV